MNAKRLVLVALLGSLLLAVSCSQQQVSREQLLATMDSLEHKVEWLEYKNMLETWDYYSTGEADSLEFYEALYNELLQDPGLVSSLQVGKSVLTDEIDLRRRDLLLAQVLWGKVETAPEVTGLRDSLAQIDQIFRPEFEGQEQSRRYVYDVYRYDSNRRRRQSAYRSWTAVGDEIADGLSRLFRVRNQLARQLGYNNFFAMVFKVYGFDVDEYRAMLNLLDSMTLKPYTGILDRIGAKLNLDDLEYWDLGYAYADINGSVDRYFPADSQMVYIKQSLKAMDLNLDKLPIYFDLEAREGKSEYVFSIPIKPPHDVRVMGRQTDGLYSALLLLHEIGHAIHFSSVVQDREIFARNINGSWSEGMAAIIVGLLREKGWLTKYGKLPPALADSYLLALKEQTIISLRMRLTWLRFEYEAYANPNRDINKLYWDLFEKYMRLPRHDEIKPWASIMHFTSVPVYLQNYIYADIIAAQTLNYIHDNYGEMVDNPRASAFLVQNYYRFGARYRWQELLKRGTNEELTIKYYIRQLGI